MHNEKVYLSIDEQIKLLKSKGLQIDSEKTTITITKDNKKIVYTVNYSCDSKS